MNTFQLVLMSLAVYRTVRLWRYDTIAEPLRARVIGSEDYTSFGTPVREGWLLEHPNGLSLWLLELLTCPWCLSVHVAFWGLLGASAAGWVDFSLTWASAAGFTASWLAVAALAAWCFPLEGVLVGAASLLDPVDDDEPA